MYSTQNIIGPSLRKKEERHRKWEETVRRGNPSSKGRRRERLRVRSLSWCEDSIDQKILKSSIAAIRMKGITKEVPNVNSEA